MMERRPIIPVTNPIEGTIRPPGSKSLTNRALPLAAVARGVTRIKSPLLSEDTDVMMSALRQLGVSIKSTNDCWEVVGVDGVFPSHTGTFQLQNSGTSIRFLAAMIAACGRGQFILDGNARMRQRPIGDLVEALNGLGVSVHAHQHNQFPPVDIQTQGLAGGTVRVPGNVSSQFLSALLMAAPLAQGPVRIEVMGERVSKPYVDMTLQVMRRFGVDVAEHPPDSFFVRPQPYQHVADFPIEPDASAASYWFAAAAITGGQCRVEGLGLNSIQGDIQFVQCLEMMGCRAVGEHNAMTIQGRRLKGIDVCMRDISDTAPTLASVALFADGPTTIRDIGNIRVKECDRLAALVTELRKLGAHVDEGPDWITIHPQSLSGTTLSTYDDHRMAMSFALIGLKVPGVVIENPGCVAKTYPEFWRDFDRLCAGAKN
jgi:3-phosphoshikimate 1-carboxyvinyltransferase